MVSVKTVWTSDNTDAADRVAIQHGYGQLLPARTMGAWVTDSPNSFSARPTSIRYRFHVSMAGAGKAGRGGKPVGFGKPDGIGKSAGAGRIGRTDPAGPGPGRRRTAVSAPPVAAVAVALVPSTAPGTTA
ncbi:alpha-galactosidase [Streptomyces sp. sk2.1]|uniref:alpha-galactosidase n=1 Tax=Streptomyces sp. sk2.1 TaxID=2478959 RepID=UPI0037DC3567